MISGWEREVRRIIGGRSVAVSSAVVGRRAAILSGIRKITTAELRRVIDAVRSEAASVYTDNAYRISSILSGVNATTIAVSGVSFSAIDVPTVRAAIAGPIAGLSEIRSIGKIPARVESLLRKDLARSIADGYRVDQLVSKWRERLGAGVVASEARSLARTAIMSASNAAHLDNYRRNRDLIPMVRWEATFDRRTCVRCGSLHGRAFPVGEAPPIPAHLNCILPGNLVSRASVLAAAKSLYRGRVVEIRTSGGRRISVTEKHPVLTSRGWVRASEVRRGDDLVNYPGSGRELLGVDPNDHDVPTSIEEVFRSLEESVGVGSARVPPSPEDLHGDADGVEGEVHVVWANGGIPGVGNASVREHLRDRDLDRAPTVEGSEPLSSGRDLDAMLERLRLSAYRVVGGLGESESLGLGRLRHACEHCGGPASSREIGCGDPSRDDVSAYPEVVRDGEFALAGGVPSGDLRIIEGDSSRSRGLVPSSNPHPGFNEVLDDRLRTTPEEFRDLLCALPCGVSLDRVVDVDHSSYSGHVYDLQTVSGTINCGGVIIHNCRCVLIPVFADPVLNSAVHSVGAYRSPSGGTYFRNKDRGFERFLRSRTPDFRADFFPSMLKREVFEKGRLSLADMVSRDGSIKTDDQIRAMLRRLP